MKILIESLKLEKQNKFKLSSFNKGVELETIFRLSQILACLDMIKLA